MRTPEGGGAGGARRGFDRAEAGRARDAGCIAADQSRGWWAEAVRCGRPRERGAPAIPPSPPTFPHPAMPSRQPAGARRFRLRNWSGEGEMRTARVAVRVAHGGGSTARRPGGRATRAALPPTKAAVGGRRLCDAVGHASAALPPSPLSANLPHPATPSHQPAGAVAPPSQEAERGVTRNPEGGGAGGARRGFGRAEAGRARDAGCIAADQSRGWWAEAVRCGRPRERGAPAIPPSPPTFPHPATPSHQPAGAVALAFANEAERGVMRNPEGGGAGGARRGFGRAEAGRARDAGCMAADQSRGWWAEAV